MLKKQLSLSKLTVFQHLVEWRLPSVVTNETSSHLNLHVNSRFRFTHSLCRSPHNNRLLKHTSFSGSCEHKVKPCRKFHDDPVDADKHKGEEVSEESRCENSINTTPRTSSRQRRKKEADDLNTISKHHVKHRSNSASIAELKSGNVIPNDDVIVDSCVESTRQPDSIAEISELQDGDELVSEYEKSDSSKQLVSALQPIDVVYGGKIDKFLDEMGVAYDTGFTCYHTVCPKYPKVSTRKRQDEGKLYINCHSGYFQCNSCGQTGSWAHLRDNIQAIKAKRTNRLWTCMNNIPEAQKTLVEMPATVAKQFDQSQDISSLSPEHLELFLSIFEWHGVHKRTFEEYGVRFRVTENEYSVLFPIFSLKGVITGYRLHKGTLSEQGDVKLGPVNTFPRGQDVFDIFGWQRKCTSPDLQDTLVITLGEMNAMALYQETGIKSLALRNVNTLPQEILPVLESYTKIILWLGTDVKAWENTKTFAKKLNERRCYIFRPTMVKKMPMQMLTSGERLADVLREARLISHQAILTFSNLRQEVYHEVAFHRQAAGTQWKRYTKLNELLKGHRRGELTVLTGPTGCGKTTFLSEYSLDLCMQGVNTLWGSFEISNVRLIKIMMQQFAGKSLTKNLDEFDEIADEFALLPMFFMTYYGQEQIAKVLEAMSHAVYVHDISHVIVDNLQFMMGSDFSEQNRFVKQDRIVGMFRSFATEKNCHVTLIIHPRKVNEGEELSTASIFGSAKVSQEADNVLLIQDQRLVRPSGRKYLQIAKNRFDGDLGVMTLTFNKESLSFIMKDKNPRPAIKEEKDEDT